MRKIKWRILPVLFAVLCLTAIPVLAAETETTETEAAAAVKLSDCEITLSETLYTYNGKEKKPQAVIRDGEKNLEKDVHYTLSYEDNINAGKGIVTITAKDGSGYTGVVKKTFKIQKAEQKIKASSKTKTKGAKNFYLNAKVISGEEADRGQLTYKSSNKKTATVDKKTGEVDVKKAGETTITITAAATENYKKTTKKITVTVNPKGTSLKEMRNLIKRGITVWWRRGKGISGYELRYSTKKSMKNAVIARAPGASVVSKTLRKLKKKRYYVQIRTYKTVKGKDYFSSWSKKKRCRVRY